MAEIDPLKGYSLGFQIGMVVLALLLILGIILGNVLFGDNDITLVQGITMTMVGVLGAANILLL